MQGTVPDVFAQIQKSCARKVNIKLETGFHNTPELAPALQHGKENDTKLEKHSEKGCGRVTYIHWGSRQEEQM